MDEMRAHKGHCLVLPFPAVGHMNPILQFSKRLQHKGLKVTLATTCFIFNTAHKISDSIAIETISDGYDEGGIAQAESSEAYWTKFKKVGSETLGQVIDKLRAVGCPIDCIIYDPHLPWVLDVAKSFGLVGAAFLTQSCAVSNIYNLVYHKLLKLPIPQSNILVPGLVPLEPLDMPSFIYDPGSYPAFLEAVLNQFSNIDKADWVLCNTFYKLEKEVVDFMGKQLRLRTIGPTIPSFYLDKRLQDDKDYGLNVFKPSTSTCTKWLNERQKGSVVYVSFGSLAELGGEQLEELVCGFREANHYFLWVVRESEQAKLPKYFVEETQEKGLVVPWCPQVEVLAHEAIGCFVTHCGWNSTLEALSLGVPLVAMPRWTDQTTNSKYICDVWKVGVRPRPDEKGIVRREAIERCIKEVMEGDIAKDINKNASRWRDFAREAADEGGCSDKNIDEFVANLESQRKS
ncbi:hypothetical protein LguiA_021456 [Lonicera macranthoides]